MTAYLNRLMDGFYTIFHPFKGFWDMKKQLRGSLSGSLTLLAIYTLMQVLRGQLTGYIFNPNYPENVNTFLVLSQVLVLFFLWCITNWCLTTLMDGEGTFREIMTVVGYCLIPLIFVNLLAIILSNAMIEEEQMFLSYIDSVGYLWAGFLIFSATMTVHQYSFGKTVGTILLTIAAMVVLVFIALLCISLVQQVITFADSLYREIAFRL